MSTRRERGSFVTAQRQRERSSTAAQRQRERSSTTAQRQRESTTAQRQRESTTAQRQRKWSSTTAHKQSEKMGWLQVVMSGLLITTIGLGIRSMQNAEYYFSSRQDLLQKEEEPACFSALFSFGSSVADTGTQAIALPFTITDFLPYGSTFFGKPSKRYSDGRLHIDFWALALKFPFLDPYLKAVGSNFHRGVNFAAAGSTAMNDTARSPFPLFVQLNQFREFKRDVLALISTRGQGSKQSNYNKLPTEDYFRDALFVIAIGGNDFIRWFIGEHRQPQEVELLVPEVSRAILHVVEALHAEGARNILVEDLFPQGCIPLFLEKYANEYSDHIDAAGCLEPFNAIVQLHNSLLKQGIVELRRRFPDASIALIDTYSKRYDIIANYEMYGLKEPLKACCGAGGDYNYIPACSCGSSAMVNGEMITAGLCANASSHAMWDGIHFTDAFNRATMRGILSGKHFEPGFNLIRNRCTLADI